MFTSKIENEIEKTWRGNGKEKRKSTKDFLFLVAIEMFHYRKSSGEIVAALFAGGRLPPIYPVITIKAL